MMTIQQYLDKIDFLQKEESKVALFEKDDLESIVLIISPMQIPFGIW
ncbi:hypothetical protein [Flavobacterium sp. 3-210]